MWARRRRDPVTRRRRTHACRMVVSSTTRVRVDDLGGLTAALIYPDQPGCQVISEIF
jgi:hypothetical protein